MSGFVVVVTQFVELMCLKTTRAHVRARFLVFNMLPHFHSCNLRDLSSVLLIILVQFDSSHTSK